MGSKKLKAIAARGNKGGKVANRKMLEKAVQETHQMWRTDDFPQRLKGLRETGIFLGMAGNAELGVSEVRWNLPVPAVHSLTRQMHLQHALEVVIWGDRRITAQRAYEMGWLNRVVPKERLMDEAMEWAERILYLAPREVRNLKEIIYRGFYMASAEGAAFARALEQNLVGMEDSVEGPRAFAEKRKPQFKNK